MEIKEKRSLHGYEKPAKPEIHGTVAGFQPAGDRILIKRLESIKEDGLIARPEVAIELADRGEVIAIGISCEEVPIGCIAKFSKYGAEEILFDDQGADRYCLVRYADVRGWHNARS